jgi:hypothetical protein
MNIQSEVLGKVIDAIKISIDATNQDERELIGYLWKAVEILEGEGK